MANKILLRGDPTVKEYKANGAITPGHLLEIDSNLEAKVHATDGGDVAPVMFADVQDYLGKAITDAYADDDRVRALVCRPGDEIYALVAAGAAAITKGDLLQSAGDGTLKKYTAQMVNEGGASNVTILPRRICARALESVDNSGGGSAARIKVEVV